MSALGRLLLSRRQASGLYGRTSRRAEDVSQEEFAALLQGSTTGSSVGDKRAMGLAAWYSGVRYLAESLAYLPINAFRGSVEDPTPRSLPLWLQVPETDPFGRPLMTRGRLFESWMVSVLHRGNAYGWKIRDDVGRVIAMRYLHPDRVKPRGVNADGFKIYRVDLNGRGNWQDVDARVIFHFVGLSEDGIVGISPVEWHAKNLGIAVAADEFAGKYFEQGTLLSSYIQLTEKTRKTIPEIKTELEEFYVGIENAHQAAVLSAGAEYKTVTLNARDAQVFEARGWSVLEVARILRVPPHKLYDLTRATFSNIEQQAIEAVGDGPRVWAERFEEQIAADPDLISRGSFLMFNLDALTRGDTAAEVAAIHSGIQDGYVSLAEARSRRGLPEAPGMDVVYRPANLHVVDLETGEVIIPAGAGLPGSESEAAADVSDSSDPGGIEDEPDDPPDPSQNGSAGSSAELADVVAET